ncbi:hypothetical protein [Brevibacillus agri]|uniref:hypothetical protein n=1 Tax=Brevibacillus agri TaxID=51101 RepID=UPI0018CDDC2E
MSRIEYISQVVKEHYAFLENERIAEKAGISVHQVRRLATKMGLRKNKEFLSKKREKVKQAQREYYRKRIKPLSPSIEQLSIIYGSLLGDGTLSRGPRSQHYAYKEHFSEKQRAYREWKQEKLSTLGFHITNSNHLYSYSHPLFSELYAYFFPDGVKIIPPKLLAQMTHPLFLATLYLDDGSLILSKRKTPSMLVLHPTIVIYTQCFTHDENEMLKSHINNTFDTNFVVASRPDGHGFILKLNKEHEVQHFLRIIQPVTDDLPSMKYKTCLHERLKLEQRNKTGSNVQVRLTSSERKRNYSEEEINCLLELHQKGMTWSEIATALNRTYWSVIQKAREIHLAQKETP